MVNDYSFVSPNCIIVIRMKSGQDVSLSFVSMLRSFEIFEISDNKVDWCLSERW